MTRLSAKMFSQCRIFDSRCRIFDHRFQKIDRLSQRIDFMRSIAEVRSREIDLGISITND